MNKTKREDAAPSDALVLFGITGDLVHKKIFPALYAIEQRRRQRGILGEGRVPLAEGQVAGDDQAAFFVAGRDHLEEQVGLLPSHR